MKIHGKVATIVAAVAAMAISSIALAEHADGHTGPSKEKPKGAPGQVNSKYSIEVENHCTFDAPANVLTVTSTIWNQSEETVTITAAFVDGFQLVPDPIKKNKKNWIDVGTEQYPEDPDVPFSIDPDPEGMNPEEYTVNIDLCMTTERLESDARALNVTTQFMINDRNFYNNCDNVDSNNDGDPLNDGDESRIDLDDPKYSVVECPPIQQ